MLTPLLQRNDSGKRVQTLFSPNMIMNCNRHILWLLVIHNRTVHVPESADSDWLHEAHGLPKAEE